MWSALALNSHEEGYSDYLNNVHNLLQVELPYNLDENTGTAMATHMALNAGENNWLPICVLSTQIMRPSLSSCTGHCALIIKC